MHTRTLATPVKLSSGHAAIDESIGVKNQLVMHVGIVHVMLALHSERTLVTHSSKPPAYHRPYAQDELTVVLTKILTILLIESSCTLAYARSKSPRRTYWNGSVWIEWL